MTEIRLLIAPNRSSTTAFMQAISQNQNVHALYQPIKTGIRERGFPDYRFFDGTHPFFSEHPNKIYFAKEVFGAIGKDETTDSLKLCNYLVFPNSNSVKKSRPIFLFREPVANWNGCKKIGCSATLTLFCRSYLSSYNAFVSSAAISNKVTCLTRDKLLSFPKNIMKQVCARWDIPYSKSMVEWSIPLRNNQNFSVTAKEREKICWQQEFLASSSTFIQRPEEDDLVTTEERDYIHQLISPIYEIVKNLADQYYPTEIAAECS